MNLNEKLSKEAILSLFEDNRKYSLPIISIIASVFLFFVFIVPQVLSFPSKIQDVDVENAKLDKIKETEKILINADKNLIDIQLQFASKALPPGKSFDEILNGISTAVVLSAAQIESYRFNNNVSNQQTSGAKSKFSSLLFEVTIIGTTESAIGFIRELYKTYPASDVISIVTSSGLTNIKILFYYKSFSSITPTDRTNLRNMSAKEKAALDEISKWNDTSIGDIIVPLESASESAGVTSPF